MFIKAIAKFILQLFGKLNVINKDLLPKEGGYVVACTHVGWLEIVWLGVAISPRSIHYMAKKELFSNKIVGWFLTKLNAFPVNRKTPGTSSLKMPLKLLQQGEIVGIFPSGTRTLLNTSLKRGAVNIAFTGGVPLIPALYSGPATISFKDLFRKKNVTVIFGEPIIFEEQLDINSKKEYQQQKLSELEAEYTNLGKMLVTINDKSK